MNSGWQTKSQVKNTECRSKPSQLQLIRRKTGCAAPKPSLFQASSVVCFAMGCIKACMWVWKEHQPSGFKHFSWILNGLRCFSLASLHTWCIPDVFASLSASPHLTYHQLLSIFLFPEHLQRAVPVQKDTARDLWRENVGRACHGNVCVRCKQGHSHAVGQIKRPMPPRAGLQHPQGHMDAGTLVPTKY